MNVKIYHDMSFFNLDKMDIEAAEVESIYICSEKQKTNGIVDFFQSDFKNKDSKNKAQLDAIDIGFFTRQEYIDYYEDMGLACIGIALDLDAIEVSCPFVFQDPYEISLEDIVKAFCRFHSIPLLIHDFGDYYLREMALTDMDDLYDLYDSPGFTDFMEPLFDRAEEEEYEENYIDKIYGIYGYGMWLLFEKHDIELKHSFQTESNDTLIGRFGVETRETCTRDSQVEMGYALRKEYQGQGIASLVCRWMMEYAYDKLGMDSIIARVDDENLPSVKLITRLGFNKIEEGLYEKKAGL